MSRGLRGLNGLRRLNPLAQIQLNFRRGQAATFWKNCGANARGGNALQVLRSGFCGRLRVQTDKPSGPAVDLRGFISPTDEFPEIPWTDFEIDTLRQRVLKGDVFYNTATDQIVIRIEIACRDADLCRQAGIRGLADRTKEVERNDGCDVPGNAPLLGAIHAAEFD